MKKFLLAGAVALTLCLGACETTGIPAQLPNASQTTADEKALYTAEAAYYGIGRLIETAVDAGKLKGANAAKVMDLNRRAYDALKAARLGQQYANSTTLKLNASKVLELIGEIQLVLNQKQLTEGHYIAPG